MSGRHNWREIRSQKPRTAESEAAYEDEKRRIEAEQAEYDAQQSRDN